MFKSIISKFQDFGKAVVTKIVGFIGGVFGIKPQIVEIPAPPEIVNEQVNNNAPEAQTEEKEEGFIKKAFKTAKKVAKSAIKAVQTAILVSAQVAYVAVRVLVPLQIFTMAWEYAQAQGLVALFIGMWQMGTIPYMILCILIAIGVGAALITVETLCSFLLQPIRRFLFPIKAHQPVTVEEPVVEENEEAEMFYVIETIEKIIKRTENQLNDRLTNLEKAIATPTPTINLEKEEIVVDSSPAITLEPVVSEVIPTVIEIEEVVDSSPTPTRKDELMEQKISELKTTIRELNKALPAPKRISSRGEKIALVARIIKAEAEVA